MPHKDPIVRRNYMRDWKRRNKERHAELTRLYDKSRHANQRAAAYGVKGRISTADVRAVIEGAECLYCGDTEALTIDHRIPLHAGGPNTPDNLDAACRPCNISKFRSERPWRWSWVFDECQHCGTSEQPHLSRGLCGPCYGVHKRGGILDRYPTIREMLA